MPELDPDFIAKLLAQDKPKRGPKTQRPTAEKRRPSGLQYVSPQKGPLRKTDVMQRCVNRGCNSPTYYKIEGISRCYPHALDALNDLCLEMETIIKELRNVV